MALTRRQRQVLDVVRALIEQNGYSPSLEEIGRELGLSSVATVHKHVTHLVQKGYVKRAWNQNRSIELVESEGGPSSAVDLPLSALFASGMPLRAPAAAETISVPANMVPDRGRGHVLRVQGDSMREEFLRHGDYLVLERREKAQEGQIVVALGKDGRACLQRYVVERHETRLRPAGPEGQPAPANPARMRLEGVVVGVIRKY